jgi:cytidylate kinase
MVLVHGPYLSGKSTVCKLLASKLGFKIIDWQAFTEKVKKSKGTEEEPFEGEVP